MQAGLLLATADKTPLTARQLAEFNADWRGGDSPPTQAFLACIHAVPVGSAFTDVTVVGNAKRTVTIVGMQVVKYCQAPLAGTAFYSPGQGNNPTIGMGFNLDSPIDYARNAQGGGYAGDFFQGHVVTLFPGEQQTFDIQVGTSLHYCRFTFLMTVATPSGVVTESIDDNGKQFELTAMPAGPSHGFSGYSVMYFGGLIAELTPALHDPNGSFVEVNPKNYFER